ncbi:MAG: hypothetical protein ACXVCF_04135 [Isosphaeraceae bacterium]
MSVPEPTMIGVSETTHPKLKSLKDDGHFREMADAYRFAIGLALAQGVFPPEMGSSHTVFSVATIDPDQSIRNAVQTIMGDQLDGGSVYKMAERLADWGIQEMAREAARGEIDVVSLFDQIKAAGEAR